MPRRSALKSLLVALSLLALATPALAARRAVLVTPVLPAREAPPLASGAGGGVAWNFADSISACPAGDSVAAGHPARLRVLITVAPVVGTTPVPRVGLPPESLRVEWTPGAGSVRVHDQPGVSFADDSTDAQGRARIVVPSLSGCGTLALTLRVSGVVVGAFSVNVRSADADGDGLVTPADAPCDLDWNGVVDGADAALANAHRPHSHRNVLYGALHQRTNLCESCEGYTPFAIGESTVSWSPDSKRLAFTIHTWPWADCGVFIVNADAEDGDALQVLTSPPAGFSDYDPSWSPLGTEIAFGRRDNTIWVKGIPGLASDTTMRLVTQHNDGTELERGDLAPAISPDGLWVAFTRKTNEAGHWELWKTPIDGDTTRRVQLTFNATGDDFYAQWSNDGQWLVFDRTEGGRHSVWRVPAAGGTPELVMGATAAVQASTPAFSPDGRVILAGIGPLAAGMAHTRDAALPGAVLPSGANVPVFPDFTVNSANPVLSPRLSPDGTRVALKTKQVWIARPNTSRPPRITHVAGREIVPRTPFVDLLAAVGVPQSFVVDAFDPEGDPLAMEAYFLAPGMTWDAPTRTLHWTPPPSALGTTTNVRFQAGTPSGGSAYAIARITVGSGADAPVGVPARFALHAARPNPFAGGTTLRLDLPRAADVHADVLDAAGRRVRALARGATAAGAHVLAWDGRDEGGRELPPGLYFVRVAAGAERASAKLLRLSSR